MLKTCDRKGPRSRLEEEEVRDFESEVTDVGLRIIFQASEEVKNACRRHEFLHRELEEYMVAAMDQNLR